VNDALTRSLGAASPSTNYSHVVDGRMAAELSHRTAEHDAAEHLHSMGSDVFCSIAHALGVSPRASVGEVFGGLGPSLGVLFSWRSSGAIKDVVSWRVEEKSHKTAAALEVNVSFAQKHFAGHVSVSCECCDSLAVTGYGGSVDIAAGNREHGPPPSVHAYDLLWANPPFPSAEKAVSHLDRLLARVNIGGDAVIFAHAKSADEQFVVLASHFVGPCVRLGPFPHAVGAAPSSVSLADDWHFTPVEVLYCINKLPRRNTGGTVTCRRLEFDLEPCPPGDDEPASLISGTKQRSAAQKLFNREDAVASTGSDPRWEALAAAAMHVVQSQRRSGRRFGTPLEARTWLESTGPDGRGFGDELAKQLSTHFDIWTHLIAEAASLLDLQPAQVDAEAGALMSAWTWALPVVDLHVQDVDPRSERFADTPRPGKWRRFAFDATEKTGFLLKALQRYDARLVDTFQAIVSATRANGIVSKERVRERVSEANMVDPLLENRVDPLLFGLAAAVSACSWQGDQHSAFVYDEIGPDTNFAWRSEGVPKYFGHTPQARAGPRLAERDESRASGWRIPRRGEVLPQIQSLVVAVLLCRTLGAIGLGVFMLYMKSEAKVGDLGKIAIKGFRSWRPIWALCTVAVLTMQQMCRHMLVAIPSVCTRCCPPGVVRNPSANGAAYFSDGPNRIGAFLCGDAATQPVKGSTLGASLLSAWEGDYRNWDNTLHPALSQVRFSLPLMQRVRAFAAKHAISLADSLGRIMEHSSLLVEGARNSLFAIGISSEHAFALDAVGKSGEPLTLAGNCYSNGLCGAYGVLQQILRKAPRLAAFAGYVPPSTYLQRSA